MIIRVCGAIVKDEKILMVHHVHAGRDYWTLPGGGVEENKTPEEAIIREVKEEVCLDSIIENVLFDEDFKNNECRCFLLSLSNEK